jgi:hypothetical protein
MLHAETAMLAEKKPKNEFLCELREFCVELS